MVCEFTRKGGVIYEIGESRSQSDVTPEEELAVS
jgi:hypothetical protein